jgi:hypothetical protein
MALFALLPELLSRTCMVLCRYYDSYSGLAYDSKDFGVLGSTCREKYEKNICDASV